MEITGWYRGTPARNAEIIRNRVFVLDWYNGYGTRSDLLITYTCGPVASFINLAMDTFVAFVTDATSQCRAFTLPDDECGVVHDHPYGRVWPCLYVIAISLRLSREMRWRYMIVDEPTVWIKQYHYVNGTEPESCAVAYPLRGRLPIGSRWRIINGGHLQRCVPAIVMVERVAPYRICMHMSTNVAIYRGIWRISFSAHMPAPVANDEYQMGYDGLYPRDPNDAGSTDVIATLLPGTRLQSQVRRRVHR